MASNDPGWGKNRNEGPPDLDEMMRDLTRKLNNLFGKKNNKPNGAPPPAPEPMSGGGVGLIIMLILAIWLATGFYIVDEGKRGVVLRFGQFLSITKPGANWHLPYPIESVDIVNSEKRRTVEIGYRGSPDASGVQSRELHESLMLTSDENIIDLQFAVQYNVKNVKDFLFNNRFNVVSEENSVRAIAESAIREVVGRTEMDSVMNIGRKKVEEDVLKLMQQILDRYQTGINVINVTMQNAQPPEQVQAAFYDAVKAGQDLERQKNEGQAYANDVIPKARGNAARLLEEANGYKQRVINEALGNANRFSQVLGQYEKAPEVTRNRMYLETQEQVLSNSSKVIVDQKSGNGSMLYLPLDKLMSQPVITPSNNVQAAPAIVQPIPEITESMTRSRDSSRSRDRETRP